MPKRHFEQQYFWVSRSEFDADLARRDLAATCHLIAPIIGWFDICEGTYLQARADWREARYRLDAVRSRVACLRRPVASVSACECARHRACI